MYHILTRGMCRRLLHRALFVRHWLKKQSGWPRETRARNPVEGSLRRQRCTRCGRDGHKIRACTGSIPIEDVDLNMPPGGDNERIRCKKKCDIYHNEEHTRPRCPDRPREWFVSVLMIKLLFWIDVMFWIQLWCWYHLDLNFIYGWKVYNLCSNVLETFGHHTVVCKPYTVQIIIHCWNRTVNRVSVKMN